MINTTAARIELRGLGYSLRRYEGEWQIKPINDTWDGPSTYYADSLADAIGTARLESAAGIARAQDLLDNGQAPT